MANRKQDEAVEQALYQSAVGGVRPVQKTYKLRRIEYDQATGRKTREYDEVVHETEEVYDPPSTTAQQFWLRNRRPAAWGGEGGGAVQPPGIVELPAVEPGEADADG